MTIHEFQQQTEAQLTSAGILTARLDTLLLLCDQLGQDKSWLLAHPEAPLTAAHQAALANQVTRRRNREPMAYIRGHQEFYGREFIVTPDTLIPRPESEEGIELLKRLPLPAHPTIVDVGTGSGCLAITAAQELPDAQVIAVDLSTAALEIAKRNAQTHHATVTLLQSDLLANITQPVDVIIANLPYVDSTWARSAETNFEPATALFAANNGLQLVLQLLRQAVAVLKSGGTILLEADPRQHAAIIAEAQQQNYQATQTGAFWLQFTLRERLPS